jgi:hypothetical protein
MVQRLNLMMIGDPWIFRCQVSAQPPAKKTAGQIEKETDER